MPVKNAHLDEKMPWTELGRTGMPIKPTGRPCGTLANLAGIAENVSGHSEEERKLIDRPAPLLTWSDVPPHQAVIDDSHYQADSSPSSLAFRAIDRAIGVTVGGGRLIRRAVTRRGR